jgi:hypothetical protein
VDVGGRLRTLPRMMRPAPCSHFALLTALLLAAVARADSAPPRVELRIMHGDDPRWAAPDWDDRNWAPLAADAFPARAGVYWVRFRLTPGCVDPKGAYGYSYAWPAGKEIDSVVLASVFSFELYWDGQLLERSGIVGASRDAEVPGPLDHLVRIPDALRGPGEHVVALRMSSYHYNFPATQFSTGFALASMREQLVTEVRRPIFPMMALAGALLMAAVGNVLLRFAAQRRVLLLCNALSVVLAVFYGLIAMRWLYNAPYDWHAPRLAITAMTMGIIAVILPWVLLEQFAVPRRGWWMAALAPLLTAAWLSSPAYEVKALWMCRAMLLVGLGVTSWAVWRRRAGARLVLAGIVAGLLAVQTSVRAFLDPSFFLIFEGLVLFVFAALGAQVQADRERAQVALLTAARLETELLKKNIQPHFLLNTLATIMEVIEREPKTAVTLIEALAGEFRILARVAGEKLIPLGHELELCRAHLRIMSLRKGARCSLAVAAGADERALVPPALFHTLVENGLTHLLPCDGQQRFELSVTPEPGRVRYTLVAHGEPMGRDRPATFAPLNVTRPPVPAPPVARREGTGLRYIKARLEESFPGRWSLQGGAVPEGWRTVIEIETGLEGGRA